MSKQLHKNFLAEQVKLLLKSYVDKEIKINIYHEGTKVFEDLVKEKEQAIGKDGGIAIITY